MAFTLEECLSEKSSDRLTEIENVLLRVEYDLRVLENKKENKG